MKRHVYKLILEEDNINRILEEDEVLEEILEYLSNMSRRMELIQSKITRIDTAILEYFSVMYALC
ncbi:hypothetical protein NMU03_01420 [Allocoprobacillus halotolerans]|uniref:Uncharacterized protein n=1 Tax=Allocoprobacillus halotolerans TaxID=2944914 RepID=A0ABY5I655_9FIRM|nr:hypothetical protein [Allocoprobacillus halotolerans]UTY39523.1 hypothetical protein NMU03_01420 [Allocoprobacillus halotolerans]